MQRPFPNGHKCPFGCNGYVTAVAAGQSQRFYSGMGIFNWYYLSSPPQVLLRRGVQLETGEVIFHRQMPVFISKVSYIIPPATAGFHSVYLAVL
jgi:hypothetical protein